MRLADGACKIAGIDIREVKITKIQPGLVADAGYVLVQPRDVDGRKLPDFYGKLVAANTRWSERTRRLMADLVDSMEEDLLSVHFNITNNEASTIDEENHHERTGLGQEGADQV